MRKRVWVLATLATGLVLAAAACGDGGETGGAPAPPSSGAPSSGAPIPGGGLSIDEAIASTLEGPLMVRGYLVAPDGGEARLCSALLESYPPQCGGPSLAVAGLDISTLDGLTATDDPGLAQVTWSEAEISILGDVGDGVITVSETSL